MSAPQGGGTPFGRLLGMRCVHRGESLARYEMDVAEDHLNKRGVAHGGVVASLLDTALGAAVVFSLAPEEWTGTLELSVQFREPVRPGLVTAEGRVARRGKRVAFAEGEVRDASGCILASAHGVWTIWPKKPD
jgi:uncharacterized protein (TIGR00369 family)